MSDFSPVAVSFQTVGSLLLALMMAQLGRMFAWRYVRNWAFAWLAMFIALGSVRVYIDTGDRIFWMVYLIAEWAFLGLLYAGSRELADGTHVPIRYFFYCAPVALLVAVIPVRFARSFNDVFIGQAAAVSIGALICFLTLGRTGAARRQVGWQTMRIALALMTIAYAAYVPLFTLYTMGWNLWFLPYSSLADLLGCIVLGFGMILFTTEEASRELTDAVTALQVVRDQMQHKLHTDPLTEALSRHAFLAMPRGITGVVIMLDIDHLKRINDQAGHDMGDIVIRSTANAIRARIRADDLLFRWGGDEFLIIVPQSTMDVVNARLSSLSEGIRIDLPGRDALTFTVSWGGAEFGGGKTLEDAMRVADMAMYGRRARRSGATNAAVRF
jgi:diguanylate cyclase (GGDEF)-like protein